MTLSISRGRKALAALATAAVVAVSLAPTSASADSWHSHHRGSYAAAGFAGGLLVGALAAGSSYSSDRERVVYDRECWTERRRVVNAYGDSYVRRIRVCE